MKHILVSLLLMLALGTANCLFAQWVRSDAGNGSDFNGKLSVNAFTVIGPKIYAGTSNGVFRSSDAGKHWQAANFGIGNVLDFMVLPHRYYLKHPKWMWVSQATRSSQLTDSLVGKAITVDPQGNAIVAATLGGTAYIEYDTMTAPLALMLIKYDTNGNILWQRSAACSKPGSAYTSVACDSSGNIYLLGQMTSPTGLPEISAIDFGSKQIMTSSLITIFVASYDASGNFRWADIADASGATSATGIAVDVAGNVYFAGNFRGSMSIGGFSVSDTVTKAFNNVLVDAGDCFLAKYTMDGRPEWLVQSSSHGQIPQFNATSGASCSGLCADRSGNCYLLGLSSDTEYVADRKLVGQYKQFIAKYNPSGKGEWVIPFDDNSTFQRASIVASLSCDANGNVAFSGSLHEGPLTFNGKSYGDGRGGYQTFAASIDSSGNTRWFKQGNSGSISQMSVSGSGNIFLVSDMYPGSPFGTDSTIAERLDQSTSIIKLRSDGSFLWGFADGLAGLLAIKRDQSLYALGAGNYISYPNTEGRYGRIGFTGTMALAKLSAEAPGYTVDTDLYASGGGFAVSVNEGRSWLALNLTPRPVFSFVEGNQLAHIDTVLFIAGSGSDASLFRSTNFGELWTPAYTGCTTNIPYIHTIGTTLYASRSSACHGPMHSTDLGSTWIDDLCSHDGLEMGIGGRTFAADFSVSMDSGRHWAQATVGLEGYNQQGTLIDDGRKALSAEDNMLLDGTTFLSASIDGGEKWHRMDEGLPSSGDPNMLGYAVSTIYQSGGYVFVGLRDSGLWRRPIAEIRRAIPVSPPPFSWASQTHAYGNASGECVAVDKQGNAVVFGHFSGAIAIGNTVYQRKNLPGLTGLDYFLAKYDPNGEPIWSMQIAGGGINDSNAPSSISIAPSGDIYVGGHFINTLTANGVTLVDHWHYPATFLLKCSQGGALQWLDTIGSSSPYTRLSQIAADKTGDVVLVGTTQGAIGGITVTDGSFMARYGSDGVAKWAKNFLSSADYSATARAVAVGPDNDYWMAGSSTDRALFLLRVNAAGNLLDSTFAGKYPSTFINSLGVDSAGNVYAEGELADSITLGTTTLKRPDHPATRFLACYAARKWKWAETIGQRELLPYRYPTSISVHIATAADGSTYVTGLDSIYGQSASGHNQGLNLVTKFNAQGVRSWTKQISKPYTCDTYSLAVSDSGSVWTTGDIVGPEFFSRYHPGDCFDMAFGVFGLGPNSFDSNFLRPYVARLNGQTELLAVNSPNSGHSTPSGQRANLFPNPATNISTLRFELEHPQTITIALCDQLGREVKLFFEGSLQSGSVEKQLDLGDIEDGSYFVRLLTGEGATIIPIVVRR